MANALVMQVVSPRALRSAQRQAQSAAGLLAFLSSSMPNLCRTRQGLAHVLPDTARQLDRADSCGEDMVFQGPIPELA